MFSFRILTLYLESCLAMMDCVRSFFIHFIINFAVSSSTLKFYTRSLSVACALMNNSSGWIVVTTQPSKKAIDHDSICIVHTSNAIWRTLQLHANVSHSEWMTPFFLVHFPSIFVCWHNKPWYLIFASGNVDRNKLFCGHTTCIQIQFNLYSFRSTHLKNSR